MCATGDYQLMVDYIGNGYADEAAGQGASLGQVKFQTETDVSYFEYDQERFRAIVESIDLVTDGDPHESAMRVGLA